MAWSAVRTTGVGSSLSSPLTLPFASNNAGDTIIVCMSVSSGGSAGSVTGITDTAGNTYTQLAAFDAGGFSGGYQIYYICQSCVASAGTNTLSIAWSAVNRLSAIAIEYSGLVTSGTSLDVSVISGTNVNSPVSATINATNDNELILAMAGHNTGGGNWSAATGTFRTGTVNQTIVVFDQVSVAGANAVQVSGPNGLGMGVLALYQKVNPPTYVQSDGTYDNSVTVHATLVKAYPGNVTAGDFLVCALAWSGSNAAASVTDTQGNTWTQVQSTVVSAGQGFAVFYCQSALSTGANTVTGTFPASSSFCAIMIGEYTAGTVQESLIGNTNGQMGASAPNDTFSVTKPCINILFGNDGNASFTLNGRTARQTFGRCIFGDGAFTAKAGSSVGSITNASQFASITLNGPDPAFDARLVSTKMWYANSGASATTAVIPFAIDNTAGNALVVAVGGSAGVTPTFTVTDSLGNSYSSTAIRSSGSGNFSQLFYVANCKGGANTVTITYTGTTVSFGGAAIAEFAFAPSQSALDVANSVASSTLSVTTTYVNDIVVGFAGDGNTTWNAYSGFSEPLDGVVASKRFTLRFQKKAAAGSVTFAPTGSPTNATEIHMVAFFSASARLRALMGVGL